MYQNSSIPKFLITNICNQLKPIFKTILSLELEKFVINQVVLHYGAQERKSPNDNAANKLKMIFNMSAAFKICISSSKLVSQEIYATLHYVPFPIAALNKTSHIMITVSLTELRCVGDSCLVGCSAVLI